MDQSIVVSALLGAIQGLTEFLPVSSSGHLTIFQHLFGLQDPESNLALDILLHSATLLAVIWFFRADLWVFATADGRARPENRRLALLVLVASIPTAVIGLGFKKKFEALFGAPLIVCCALVATGVLLLAAHWQARRQAGGGIGELSLGHALFIGILQGIAITPGISRSGSTIAAGIFSGMKGEEAGRFSFLLMIVSVGGATLLE
ncbi:MAG TPA: undecaprenyl-diphosphate phosphatase, partial [Candidatus Ozemobacteraceae bacterium]|nr:undecaprenyl-diphosphate phosphatase [Candidatus Ozemobacteraceae bacterium]